MRKRILSLLLCIVLCLSMLPMSAFAQELPSMQNVKIENGILSWDAFPGADGYNLFLGSTGNLATGTSYDLNGRCAEAGFATGDYAVKLYAMDSAGNQISEAWTGTFHYVSTKPYLARPTNLRFEGSTCKWDAVPYATSYNVTLLGEWNDYVDHAQLNSGTQYTFTLETGKRYKFKVVASAFGYENSEATSILYTYNGLQEPLYTVTFDMNGHGTQVPAQTVKEGYPVIKPADPTAEGWKFEGWYTDATFSEAFDFNTAINANTTVYAKWTKAHYVDIKSSSDGTVTSDMIWAITGDIVTLTVTPADGYFLSSLTVKDDSNSEIALGKNAFDDYTFSMPDSKATVSAEFYRGLVTTPDASYTVPVGGKVDVIFRTELGYRVNNGYIQPQGGSRTEFSGVYSDSDRKVSIYYDGSKSGQTITYLYSLTPINISSGEKMAAVTGTFQVTFEEGENVFDATFPNESLTLTYGETETSVGQIKPTSVTGNIIKEVAVNTTWTNLTSGSNTIPMTVVFDKYFGELKLLEHENARYYAETLYTNSDSVVGSRKCDYFIQISEADWAAAAPGTYNATITYEAYAILEGSTAHASTITKNTNVTVIVPGDSSEYTVTFDMNGHGDSITAQTVKEGYPVIKPADPTAEGWKFEGWYKNEALTEEYNFGAMVFKNITLYAKWVEIEHYTVTYDANGGTGSMPGERIYVNSEGKAIYSFPTCGFTAPEGKKFDHWEVEENNNTFSEADQLAIFGDVTVKPIWKDAATPQPTTYTVSFNMNGRGNQVADQTINAGEKVTEPAEPTEIGYMFVGWYKDSEFNTAWNFDTDTVTADTTLYALWAKNIANYTVTFDMNGHGNPVAAQTVKEGEKAAKPADPTASGWTFGGWYKEAACSTAFSFDTAITADTKVYAKWTENTVKPVDPEKPNKPEKPEKPEKPVKPAKPGKPASPNTADTNQALLWVMLMILGGALAGAELYSRKRKN